MKKSLKYVLLIVAAIVVMGIWGFKNYLLKNNTNPFPVPSDQVSDQAGQTSLPLVIISDFGFNPQILEVESGTVVSWTNNTQEDITLASSDLPGLNSGRLSPGQSFSFIVEVIGEYEYYPDATPEAKGKIIIKEHQSE